MRYLSYLIRFAVSLFTPGRWEDKLTGEFNGMKYRIQSQERGGIATMYFMYRLKLGNYQPIKIDTRTYNWGPPYNVEIFNGVKHFMFRDIVIPDPPISGFEPTVLYIPCNGENDKTCQAYFDLFESKWDHLKTVLYQLNNRYLPPIMGIVAGKKEDFERAFTGIYRDKKYLLKVEADGKVTMLPANRKEDFSTVTKLYPKLVMPGAKIVIEATPDNITVEGLTRFKDEKGFGPEHYFGIEVLSFEAIRLDDIKTGLQKGLRCYEQKDWKTAYRFFDSISVKARSEDYDYYRAVCEQYMGNIAFLLGNTEKASAHYNDALASAERLPELQEAIRKDLEKLNTLKTF